MQTGLFQAPASASAAPPQPETEPEEGEEQRRKVKIEVTGEATVLESVEIHTMGDKEEGTQEVSLRRMGARSKHSV